MIVIFFPYATSRIDSKYNYVLFMYRIPSLVVLSIIISVMLEEGLLPQSFYLIFFFFSFFARNEDKHDSLNDITT